MKADIEGQPLVGPLEQAANEDQVSRRGDRQEFGQALNDAQKSRTQQIHRTGGCVGRQVGATVTLELARPL